MTISAKVIEDSIAPNGKRLTTLQLQYQRFIHSEVMTHRVFSRGASSSRAIPVSKMVEQVRANPAMPIHWGKNQAGMQANEELDANHKAVAKDLWLRSARLAAEMAEHFIEVGAHKQIANRILEPFQFIHVIVTATEFDNFFELRCHKDAQPEIQALASEMRRQLLMSQPVYRKRDRSLSINWHLPYVTPAERLTYPDKPEFLAKLSAARCARVSYLTHDGQQPTIEKDLELYDRLVGGRPLHASPIEHQAYPLPLATQRSNNFVGWRQNRELVEASFNQ